MASLTFKDDLFNDPFKNKIFKKDTTYKHFGTVADCDLYIINNKHLKIDHKCCGGKGIKIRIDPEKPEEDVKKGTCDICFMDNVSLYSKCNTCVQPFCESCLDKIVSKVCPYCRGQLK